MPKDWAEPCPTSLPCCPARNAIDKTLFSCFGSDAFCSVLKRLPGKRNTLLLCGMESHICVTQTALGALREGYLVHIASDAVSSRTEWNWKIGLDRMRAAGAVISSTEMMIYELMRVVFISGVQRIAAPSEGIIPAASDSRRPRLLRTILSSPSRHSSSFFFTRTTVIFAKPSVERRRLQLRGHAPHDILRHDAIAALMALNADFQRNIEEHGVDLVVIIFGELDPVLAFLRSKVGGVHVVHRALGDQARL